MTQFNDRNFRQAEQARSRNSAVAGDDAVFPINQDRTRPPKFSNAGCHFGDLLRTVSARIPVVWSQGINRNVLDHQAALH